MMLGSSVSSEAWRTIVLLPYFYFSDTARCVEWAIYSDRMDLLNLAPQKLLNKVVCDFHFQESNFMNYKRERLTKTTAVPTIYRNADKTETDLKKNPPEWVEANRKAVPEAYLQSSLINMDESLDFTSVEEEDLPAPTKKMKAELSSTPVRILNGTTVTKARVPVRKELPTKSQPQVTKVVKVAGGNFRIHEMASSPKILKQEIIRPAIATEEEHFEEIETIDQIPCSTPLKVERTEEVNPILLKQIAEIKEMINKNQAASTSFADVSIKSEEATNISQSQFNKVQLFNGIKRYLSPSMIALLRMELFAAPAREYKKDEKIICQELYLLGESTYTFLTDEWRLRLPATKDVESWIEQKTYEDDDDAS